MIAIHDVSLRGRLEWAELLSAEATAILGQVVVLAKIVIQKYYCTSRQNHSPRQAIFNIKAVTNDIVHDRRFKTPVQRVVAKFGKSLRNSEDFARYLA